MNRRRFLTNAMAGVAAAATVRADGAQAPMGPRSATANPTGRGEGPAPVPLEKLARVGIMTLNHGPMLRLPWNATPSPAQTLALFDLPQYYVDQYGVRNIEFQHTHLAQGTSEPDVAFFRELKSRIDAAGSRANQINLEIGAITELGAPDARAAWMAHAKKWVDAAPVLGATRLLLNQSGLNDQNMAVATAVWKEIQDYARPKGIKISAENRPYNSKEYGPPADLPNRSRFTWGLLEECARAAGGYTNVDFGRTGRFLSQRELHEAIAGMFTSNAGSVHVKTSPLWDLGTAIRYTESLGFTGLYTIEVDLDPAVRMVYNIVLANMA
ncbi:MAG: hypothetical protein IT184_12220 [Acidobacteria bacterium]|nr:hypothetical protein [Acidobacteriota bacterium]